MGQNLGQGTTAPVHKKWTMDKGKKQRQLLECGKVPHGPSIFLNPATEQYLALQRENRQLRMENELLRGFHRSLEKR